VLSVGGGGRTLEQSKKHIRTSTHKLKPLNHFTVVPHPLSPLRFSKLRASPWLNPVPGTRRIAGHPVVHVRGHELPVVVAPDGGVHPVDTRMTGAHDVVFQPEEVQAQDERDIDLDSPVQKGDTKEGAPQWSPKSASSRSGPSYPVDLGTAGPPSARPACARALPSVCCPAPRSSAAPIHGESQREQGRESLPGSMWRFWAPPLWFVFQPK